MRANATVSHDARARRRRPLQEEVLQVAQALQALPGGVEAARAPGVRGAPGQAPLRRDRRGPQARDEVRTRVRRLTAGGPHYYALRADSEVGGEVYERMLLERLPAHGIDVALGLPQDHRVPLPPPPGWRVTVLRHRLGLHWLRAPLIFTPYVVRLLRSGRADLLRGHSVRHTGPA